MVVFGFHIIYYGCDAIGEEKIFVDLYEKILVEIQRRDKNRFELASFKFRYIESVVHLHEKHSPISELISVTHGTRRLLLDRVQYKFPEDYFVISASSKKALNLMPAMINLIL